MKRILIISELFYPNNAIGAHRPTKIAKKLHSLGYKVDVFTRYSFDDTADFCDNLFSFDTMKGSASVICSQPQKKHGKLYTALYHISSPIRIIRNMRRVLKEFKRLLAENDCFKNAKYGAVFSSFGPLSSLFCGLHYKKTHRETKWICDFRDPVVVKYIPMSLRPVFRIFEKTACRHADAIVAVSNGYLERICKGKHKNKAFMIPNGYDLDDNVFTVEAIEPEDFMRITYVGALYGGDRDLSPLFKAIEALCNEGSLDKRKIKVSYAGNEYGIIKNQADIYNLEDILENHGTLSRNDCLKLQFSSHMLLVSTWNNKNEYGVFPGKLLEYMLINKPIISITTGNMPNGEVTQIIRQGDFGVAYEEARSSEDFENLKKYIEKSYNEWSVAKKISFEPSKELLERYNYKFIINQMEDLING